VPSPPILPKKKKPCLLPESDTKDPLVPKSPRNRLGRRPPSSEPRECTVDHDHKALLPPLDETTSRLTTGLTLHVHVTTYDDSPTCVGSPACRRHRVMTEGQPFANTSPDNIPRICSPSPDLMTNRPPPLQILLVLFKGSFI
jgi:hypothetical protein